MGRRWHHKSFSAKLPSSDKQRVCSCQAQQRQYLQGHWDPHHPI